MTLINFNDLIFYIYTNIILERNIITQRQKILVVEWASTQKQDRIPTEPYKHKGNYTRKKELYDVEIKLF